jgi:hypothetical protein
MACIWVCPFLETESIAPLKIAGSRMTMNSNTKLGLAAVAFIAAIVLLFLQFRGSSRAPVPPMEPVTGFIADLQLTASERFLFVTANAVDGTAVFDGIVETKADLDALNAKIAAVNPKPPVKVTVKVGKTPVPIPKITQPTAPPK